MQFLVIAYDYEDAHQRRLDTRQEHIDATYKLMESGNVLSGAALIEDDKMVGSTLIVEFETEDELDKWLENEPYVKNRVWNYEEIQIVPIRVLPKK